MTQRALKEPFELVGRLLLAVNLKGYLRGEDLSFSFTRITNLSLNCSSKPDGKKRWSVFLFARGSDQQPIMLCMDECFADFYREPPEPLRCDGLIGDHLIYNIILRRPALHHSWC